MTAAVCAVCDQPLGDDWPHLPHDDLCPQRFHRYETDCECRTLPVHPGCCPCAKDQT